MTALRYDRWEDPFRDPHLLKLQAENAMYLGPGKQYAEPYRPPVKPKQIQFKKPRQQRVQRR